jgi:hypothetical protein
VGSLRGLFVPVSDRSGDTICDGGSEAAGYEAAGYEAAGYEAIDAVCCARPYDCPSAEAAAEPDSDCISPSPNCCVPDPKSEPSSDSDISY